MQRRKTSLDVGIIMIFIASGVVVALSQPFSNPLIVVFGYTQAENAAVDTLLAELPHSQVVDFDSSQYHFLKMKCIGVVILMGHGTEEGILDDGKLIDSQSIAREISMIPAQRIMISSCNSKDIADLDRTGRTFGFSHVVDAELAALEIVLRIQLYFGLIQSAISVCGQFFELVAEKMGSTDSFLPLYVVYDDGGGGGSLPPNSLSNSELWNAIYILIGGLIFALLELRHRSLLVN